MAIHRRIAGLLAESPQKVIAKARANLDTWRQRHQGTALEAIYQEWADLLDSLSPAEISELIVADDERATRLRQSSPFVGILSPAEVWSIKRSHATT